MTVPCTALPALVRAQVDRSADSIAVQDDRRRLTYRELVASMDRIATALRTAGVGAESVVGVCTERSVDMVLAVLGVMSAGGAYLAMDPDTPVERGRQMLEVSGARHVLVTESTGPAVQAMTSDMRGREVWLVHDILRTRANTLPHPPIAPDDLAYVLFTSGSTGEPKGVAMPHRPLLNLIDFQVALTARHHRGQPVRALQYTPLTFDVSFLEILSTLVSGGTLVVADEVTRRDPQAVIEAIARHQITSLFLPLVMLHHVADAGLRSPGRSHSLREVVTGGEQLVVTPQLREWLTGLPECTLTNIYGPTETHVVTTLDLAGEPSTWSDRPSIGAPIPGAGVHLLDRKLRPVRAGEAGEVCLSGICLARGYAGRPDLTAERFVTALNGERIYRTGDLARRNGDGELMFLGRLDSQVKIRGMRVEPGEVEAVLGAHPEVDACAVLARPGVDSTTRLVAYVTPRQWPDGLPAEPIARQSDPRWHVFLSERLPGHSVPATYVLLPVLPLTTSGKIDRGRLPQPSTRRPDLAATYRVPRTATEKALAVIWADVLQLDRVGLDDGLFDLGGHSLLLIQLQARIAEELGHRVSTATLFVHPTIRSLSAHLNGSGAISTADHAPRRPRPRQRGRGGRV